MLIVRCSAMGPGKQRLTLIISFTPPFFACFEVFLTVARFSLITTDWLRNSKLLLRPGTSSSLQRSSAQSQGIPQAGDPWCWQRGAWLSQQVPLSTTCRIQPPPDIPSLGFCNVGAGICWMAELGPWNMSASLPLGGSLGV